MKIKPPPSLLEKARRKVVEAVALDAECGRLLNDLIEDHRHPGQPAESLLLDWAPRNLANFEKLKLALPRLEDQMTGQPVVLVDDGTTL